MFGARRGHQPVDPEAEGVLEDLARDHRLALVTNGAPDVQREKLAGTTLARYFLSRLDARTATAFVLYPALTAAELLRSILEDLHVPATGTSLSTPTTACPVTTPTSRPSPRRRCLPSGRPWPRVCARS